MGFRLGIDVGGTFTDFTLVDEHGAMRIWKEDSNAEDPSAAIALGLEALAGQLGRPTAELLRETDLFVHGTTRATNVVLQRSGPPIGLLCTAGFRDVLYFRDAYKTDRFNVHKAHPRELVPRHLRLGVSERIDARGEVRIALDEDQVRAAAASFREAAVAAVAVAFLWSIVNPAHERRAVEILREELPGTHIFCSSAVLPEIREWERTSATVLSAYVMPGIAAYLGRLHELLYGLGYTRPLQIMQVNGGCASIDEILRRPVNVLASGPAAAPAAARFHAEQLAASDAIVMDMGGTSFDVCLIRDRRPAMSRTIQVEEQPIGVPGVEIHSVGAGGGSIAWIDGGGALRVGPYSAGARPGPAAYGNGGRDATVTDANIVLGYLAADAFLGGRRKLDATLARKAVRENVAEPLGLDDIAAAAGIVRVVDAAMVDAIRAVSVERGVDPRRFLLVVGGGAGGLHAARLARELGMRQVIVPKEASTLCAFGMTVTDVRHDYSQALHSLSTDMEFAEVDRMMKRMEDEARARLLNEGFSSSRIVLERSVDARYPGQVHELTLPIRAPSGGAYSARDLAEIERAFHDVHEDRFSYARRELPIEFMHWRVSAVGQLLPIAAPVMHEQHAGAGDALLGRRQAYSPETGAMTALPVHAAHRIATTDAIDGPAIVQAETTTVLIGPGDRLTLGAGGVMSVQIAAGEAVVEGAQRQP